MKKVETAIVGGLAKLTKESFEVYYRDKVLLQIEELLTKFKPLSMLWFDT